MLVTSLTDREVETLILAVRYWRYNRQGEARRTDRLLTKDEVDVLLAKLASGTLSSLPSDDFSNDLFSR